MGWIFSPQTQLISSYGVNNGVTWPIFFVVSDVFVMASDQVRFKGFLLSPLFPLMAYPQLASGTDAEGDTAAN